MRIQHTRAPQAAVRPMAYVLPIPVSSTWVSHVGVTDSAVTRCPVTRGCHRLRGPLNVLNVAALLSLTWVPQAPRAPVPQAPPLGGVPPFGWAQSLVSVGAPQTPRCPRKAPSDQVERVADPKRLRCSFGGGTARCGPRRPPGCLTVTMADDWNGCTEHLLLAAIAAVGRTCYVGAGFTNGADGGKDPSGKSAVRPARRAVAADVNASTKAA